MPRSPLDPADMDLSPDAPAEPDQKPTDMPLRVAAIGSSVLALPGLFGWGGLMYFLALALSMAGSDLPAVALIVAGILLVPVGFYLLAGYWRAIRQGTPAGRPSRFWWLSAGYNASGSVLAVASMANPYALAPSPLAALVLVWTAFMVWLSVTRARAASVADDTLAV